MDTLAILERLVGFDTTSARSNLALIAFVEDFLKTRGFSIARFEDETGQKAGLYAQIGPQEMVSCCLGILMLYPPKVKTGPATRFA